MSPVIGIDLGTTNSVVAVLEGGSPVVIANAEGNRTTPSVVHFAHEGDVVVGELAKRMLVPEPTRTIKSIKRFMGLRFSEVEEQRRLVHYEMRGTERDDIRVHVARREYSPEIVSAEVLKKMKATAEAYLGDVVEQAVVTVPAYFNDTQRQATKLAGELAGLDVLRIVNEPTAACLAYGMDAKESEKVVVFDFGGGTFDISLIEMDDGVFEVKATCGDNLLGGDTLDGLLADYFTREIARDLGLDISKDLNARQRISELAEKTKCELSTLPSTNISLPFIGMVDNQPVHYSRELKREEFEKIVAPALSRIEHPCLQALSDAGWGTTDVSKVLLVGGSTRIPAVRRIAEEIFGKPPSSAVNPDEAVAMGAAIQGAVLTGGLAEVLLLDVTPLSLGVGSQGGVLQVIIPRNSNVPTEAHRPFTTTRDFQRSVKISVFQGERKVAAENRVLSEFRLENITAAPKGVPHIDVNFRIDADGILNVTASDISTGARQEVRIDSFMTTKEEALHLIEQAELAAEADRQYLARSVSHLRALKLQECVQAMIAEYGAKLHSEDVRQMRELLLKIDVSFHLQDAAALELAYGQLTELAEKQGDNFLTTKTKLGMA